MRKLNKNVKKIIFILAFTGSLSFFGTTFAQMGMMGNYWYNKNQNIKAVQDEELNNVLQNIYQSQGVSKQTEVDCSKVTDDQFEKLGDTYMDLMLPNENQHEMMDQMMGGEGSSSLRQAHINMGRSYLGCWSDYNSAPIFMPMMQMHTGSWGMGSFGPMGGNGLIFGPYQGSLGNGYLGYGIFNLVFKILWFILAVIGVITLIKWLVKGLNKNKS